MSTRTLQRCKSSVNLGMMGNQSRKRLGERNSCILGTYFVPGIFTPIISF